jgi:hypothetical protein
MLLVLAGLVIPAAALDISTSQYNGNIQAGGTISYAVLAGVPWEGDPVDLLVDVKGINQNPDLQFVAVEPQKDTYAYSARKFTSVNSSEIHVDKGNKKQIILTFHLPADVGDGGRYAMVVVHTLPGKNVTEADYNIPVFLTILGSNPSLEGGITSLEAGPVTAGQPVMITTGYKNTGNIHQNSLVNTVTITSADGKTVYSNATDPLAAALLPDKSYTFSLRAETQNLPAGTYSVTSKVTAEGTRFMDKKTLPLVVSPGATPAAAVTVTASSVPTPAPTKSPLLPVTGIAALLGAVALILVWRKVP